MEIALLDTNVLIEILKGDESTIEKVQTLDGALAISSVSVMELYYGAFNKAEIKQIDKFVSLFKIMHIDKTISLRAMTLVKRYAKSHSLDIPDSLIVATALVNDCSLLTYDVKDFKFIEGLRLS